MSDSGWILFTAVVRADKIRDVRLPDDSYHCTVTIDPTRLQEFYAAFETARRGMETLLPNEVRINAKA